MSEGKRKVLQRTIEKIVQVRYKWTVLLWTSKNLFSRDHIAYLNICREYVSYFKHGKPIAYLGQ